MATPGRNEPCPRGSGRKYKRCCWARNRAAAAPAVPPGARVLQRDGERFVASEGVSPETMDLAAGYFEQERRGPAQMMVEFAQPLIEMAGDDQKSLNRAMSMAMAAWNLALCPDEDSRQSLLSTLMNTLPDEEQVRADFRMLALRMVERHREMFPGMHRGR